ncbi:NHL repeat-containing protein [bacterium]|nr:NHL repeat-containing protein [bacterium]
MPSGEIVVADSKNNRVQVLNSNGLFQRFISLSSGTPGLASFVSLIGGAWTASETVSQKASRMVKTKGEEENNNYSGPRLDLPIGLAFDKQARLFVSSSGNHRIWVFRFKDGALLNSIGKRGRGQGELDTPMDIDIRQDGTIAVADFGNRRVQLLDSLGKFIHEIYYKEETKKKELRSLAPRGVLWLPNGDLLVSYPTFHQVVCWNIKGVPIWQYGAFGKGKGELNEPSYMVQGPGENVIISDSRNHRLVEITNNGFFVKNFSGRGTTPGRVLSPRGLALSKEESLIISDQGNNRIHFFQLGKVASIIRDAKAFAIKDRWDDAMPRIEQALNLEPNQQDARDLMVNALHYFGDRSYQNENYSKAEESYRRVLIYNPQDNEVPKKLDAVFWAKNKDLIMRVGFALIGIITALILFWVIKTMFLRIVFSHK